MRGSSKVKDKDEKKRDGDKRDGGAGDKNKAGERGWEEVRIPLREAGEWRSHLKAGGKEAAPTATNVSS